MKLTANQLRILEACARDCSLGHWCTATVGKLRVARRLHALGLLVDMAPGMGGDGRRVFRTSAKGKRLLLDLRKSVEGDR